MSDDPLATHRAWLTSELPTLVRDGVIDSTTAERLRARYESSSAGSSATSAVPNRAVLVFAVLGAGLIGAGIMLLVAHNWDELSRPIRALICLLLLALAQASAAFALIRRERSAAWREGASVFLVASLGAALSLVSQTYHAQGEISDLVLGWIALALPVIYLLEARIAAIVIVLLALVLPLGRDHAWDRGYAFFAVLSGVGPFLVRVTRTAPRQMRTAWFQTIFAASLALGGTMLVGRDAPSLLPLFVTTYFAGVLAIGRVDEDGGLRGLAAVTVLITALTLTFEGIQRSLFGAAHQWGRGEWLWLVAIVAMTLFSVPRLLRSPAGRRRMNFSFAAAAIPALAALALSKAGSPAWVMALMFDVYVLALGLERLLAGLRDHARGWSNFGLLALSSLFVLRFFDTDWSFAVRGLGMIAVGSAFLAVNLHLTRRDAARLR